MLRRSLLAVFMGMIVSVCTAYAGEGNLVLNASFEDSKPGDPKGLFPGWIFTQYEGQCGLCASHIAHSGKASAMLCGDNAPKMRLAAGARSWSRAATGSRPISAAWTSAPASGTRPPSSCSTAGQVLPAREERHLRLDEADLRRRDQGEEEGRARRSA